ncbi:MAG TPA: hypothetical protein VIC71_04485 [Gammaproteobacteria bacterium]
MAKSKRRMGKGPERNTDVDADAEIEPDTYMDEGVEDLSTTNKTGKGRRPRREMRERIEARDEERLLTRELSDWESYDRDLDSEKT